MALQPLMLARLCERLKNGDAIASMGYPDITLGPVELEKLLGDKFPMLEYRDDSEAICKRHGLASRWIPDSESLFELFGASLDVYDVVAERGGEIVIDLNYPFPANACGQYDYVLDVGTLEHCFNVAQALVNMACLVKVGGVVFHENPFNWGNHGFYNLNPTLFHDFYGDNGFKVLACNLLPRGTDVILEVPSTSRFQFVKAEANLMTVVERVEEKEITFPMQTKYRRKA